MTMETSPATMFLAVEREHGTLAAISAVRAAYGLSLESAKAVMVQAHGEAQSLSAFQESLLPDLEAALEQDGGPQPPSRH
jgi:hypothetical protein